MKEIFTITTIGRLNRLKFIKNSIIIFLIFLLIYSLILISAIVFPEIINNEIFKGVSLIVILGGGLTVFAINLSLQIRRLHDLDLNGAFVLLSFIPFINIGLLIYMLFFKGTTGSNKYGTDPLLNLNQTSNLENEQINL